jgi:hypothetical protein
MMKDHIDHGNHGHNREHNSEKAFHVFLLLKKGPDFLDRAVFMFSLEKARELEPESLFHVCAGFLHFFGSLFGFPFRAGEQTIRFALGQHLIFFHSLFSESPEPVPDLIDRSVLAASCGISGHGKASKHEGKNEGRHHEFTHRLIPFFNVES